MTPVFDPQIGGYLRESFKLNLGAHAYIVVGEKQHLPDLLKECAYVALCRNRVGADNCEACAKIAENAHQDVIRHVYKTKVKCWNRQGKRDGLKYKGVVR